MQLISARRSGPTSVLDQTFAPAPGTSASPLQALLVEILFTFALVIVVLNSATHPATKGNSYYGLAIGFTVLAGAVSVGGVSGGAFNPAVGLAVYAMGMESAKQLAVYFAADLAGGAVAALVYLYVNGKD